jgi:hypothetical protein
MFKKLKQLFTKQVKTLVSPLQQPPIGRSQGNLSQADQKAKFLSYTKDPEASFPQLVALKGLQPRQVSPGALKAADQLKLKLLQSIDTLSAKKAIDALLSLGAYDAISLTLRKKKANISFYKYAAHQALQAKDYTLALRLVKDIQKPVIYKDILETIVRNEDYEAVDTAIASIEAYICYYHRLSSLEANTYKQYAYTFAALEAAKRKAYQHAFAWAKKTGRCYFVWVDLVSIIAQNKDFWEVERFAEEAHHLKQAAYACALSHCEESSPWAEAFSKKAGHSTLSLKP